MVGITRRKVFFYSGSNQCFALQIRARVISPCRTPNAILLLLVFLGPLCTGILTSTRIQMTKLSLTSRTPTRMTLIPRPKQVAIHIPHLCQLPLRFSPTMGPLLLLLPDHSLMLSMATIALSTPSPSSFGIQTAVPTKNFSSRRLAMMETPQLRPRTFLSKIGGRSSTGQPHLRLLAQLL